MKLKHSSGYSRVLSVLKVFRSKTGKQTSMLYLAGLLGILLGIASSSIVARVLGPEKYGVLAFYNMVTIFAVQFFQFGFAGSGRLLVARAQNDREEREIVGASTAIFALIGLSYSLFIFGASFSIDTIFHTYIGHILKLVAILLMINPMQLLLNVLMQGSNKIGLLSAFRIAPRILYIMGVLILLAFSAINVISLILLKIGIAISVILFTLKILKPSFEYLRQNIKKLGTTNRKYGLHLYVGKIVQHSTRKLDGILISYFADTTNLGFYSLAAVATSLIPMLSVSLSTSLFKDFAKRERIPRKVICFNFLWLASCVLGVILIGKHIIVLLLSERFLPVAQLIVPLAIASFFQGAYQPYNMFLGARGERRIGYLAFIAAPINTLGNLILVPRYGAFGAAVALAISMASWYVLYLLLYWKHIGSLKWQKGI